MVGGYVKTINGTCLYLPPIKYSDEDFLYEEDGEQYWTKEALIFGNRLASTISSLADTLKGSSQATPPPLWVGHSSFRLAAEALLEANISQTNEQLTALQKAKVELERELESAGVLRNLLFEQGKPLEAAILIALTYIGFKAIPFANGESEFDVVFEAVEGRFIGEAEGKDKKAINIDKLSQLERNIQEDFGRDGIDAYAKGVLFGNAYRLSPLKDRSDFFTTKCLTGAKRAGVALVRTPDLFTIAKYLSENPTDAGFAKECRLCIANTSGDVVIFPQIPIEDLIQVSE